MTKQSKLVKKRAKGDLKMISLLRYSLSAFALLGFYALYALWSFILISQ